MLCKLSSRNFHLFLALAIVACGKSPDPGSPENPANLPVEPAANSPQERLNRLPAGTDTARPSIDPNSAAAAREVLLAYIDLLEDGRRAEARTIWSEGSDSSGIVAQLDQLKQFDAAVGDPGPLEGAAGSIYVDVPLQISGQTKDGEALALAGTATLRRVNDVPGSTEAQRRWRIERIEPGV